VLIVGGAIFTVWILGIQIGRGANFWAIVSFLPVSALIVVAGVFFVLEGRRRRRDSEAGLQPHPNWWLRNLQPLIALGLPLVVSVVVSAAQLPGVLSRVDDGDRSARQIEGNGVSLVWAPEGPGWNWKQSFGGYPSWDNLALYGRPPVGLERKLESIEEHATEQDMRDTGLCRYLSADGLTLMDEPQDVWRMPTTDEFVCSLVKRGENAGCVWEGQDGKVSCRVRPDKETPLWAPDREPIYMWTGEQADPENGWFVSYAGYVQDQPKNWGNPRHGYRCVREP
jgi:hypothetical protein